MSWIRSLNSLVIDTEYTSAINSAYGGISKKRGAHKQRFGIRIKDYYSYYFPQKLRKTPFS